MREIKQHGQLQHSCIVPLYAAFEDQDGIYLLQEFLPGKNVSKLLHGIGGFIVEEKAKSIAASLCAAINYMHDKVRDADEAPTSCPGTTDAGLAAVFNEWLPVPDECSSNSACMGHQQCSAERSTSDCNTEAPAAYRVSCTGM